MKLIEEDKDDVNICITINHIKCQSIILKSVILKLDKLENIYTPY